MKTLEEYLQIWQLSNPKLLTQTGTSHIYKVMYNDNFAVLKLLNSIGIEDEKNGALTLKFFNGHSAVRLFEFDDSACLLEYADGANLKTLVEQGKDAEATKIIADVINELHRQNQEIPKALTTLTERYQSLFRKADQDKLAGDNSIFTRASKVARKLLANEKDLRVLHGDIHHENILFSSKRGWLAIDPKGLYGERTYDAANTLCNPRDIVRLATNNDRLLTNAKILGDIMGVEISRLIAFAFTHAVLSACWALEDGTETDVALNMASMIEPNVNI